MRRYLHAINKGLFFSFLLAWATFSPACANNLTISNPEFSPPGTLEFDIRWEHSWRSKEHAPYNRDAVWVFIKYRTSGSWEHLPLSTYEADYTVESELPVQIHARQTGFLVERAAPGQGTANARITITLPNAYTADNVRFRIMGMEMVYIPESSFYLGDGASINSFRRGDSPAPYHVTSNTAIPIGSEATSLSADIEEAPAGSVPQSYPKGYHAFYAMKYEITQSQYRDFLNMLSFVQQEARTAVPPAENAGTFAMQEAGGNRNGIAIHKPGTHPDVPAVYACNLHEDGSFNQPDDGAAIPVNWLKWADLSAYLDWAGLSPMTEMEYEKICRGPAYPVPGEIAWSTPHVKDANTLVNAGFANETVEETGNDTTGLANHGYNGVQGPLRAGFAATSNANRTRAGAAYYGVMEMSGNLWELCVTVNEQGLQFTGRQGDGELSDAGYANEAHWPDPQTAEGACHKGGAFLSGIYEVGSFRDLAISDRYYTGLPPEKRRKTTGGRGVLRLD